MTLKNIGFHHRGKVSGFSSRLVSVDIRQRSILKCGCVIDRKRMLLWGISDAILNEDKKIMNAVWNILREKESVIQLGRIATDIFPQNMLFKIKKQN